MARVGDAFYPGDQVPVSGLYVCDTDDGKFWSVNLEGERFPSLPDECHGNVWVLAYATDPAHSRRADP